MRRSRGDAGVQLRCLQSLAAPMVVHSEYERNLVSLVTSSTVVSRVK
jgi:hypothetical protein